MWKLGSLIWSLAATVFSGALIVVVLTVPSLAAASLKNIPYAVLAGVILAIPVAFGVTKAILAQGKPQA